MTQSGQKLEMSTNFTRIRNVQILTKIDRFVCLHWKNRLILAFTT